MPLDALAPILNDHLHGQGRLRVWSLIVTFLGDAIEPRGGGAVQSARITSIMDRLGVSRAAQRTALSRLVADGWIERDRDPADGRAAIFRFSAIGRQEFIPAARLVYAAPGAVTSGDWVVTQSTDPRGIMIAPGVGLWPAGFAPRYRGLTLIGRIEEVPDNARVVGAEHDAETAALLHLARYIQHHPPSEPLDAMAARTVLIHRWRRYVLRFPELPPAIAPLEWEGLTLRAHVAQAYLDVQAPSETWLSSAGAGFAGLPPGDAGSRFGRKE